MKTQKIKEGALIQIDLGNHLFCYGQIVGKSEIAFFNFFSDVEIKSNFKKIYSQPILFVVAVMNSAVKSGRWKIIDSGIVDGVLKIPRNYFIQDKLTKQFSIYTNTDGAIRPATFKECEELECAAVWEPEHVEDRLRDYFHGRPNICVEQMKPIFNVKGEPQRLYP